VTVTLEGRALEHLETEHAAVEVLRPLGVGGHETFVLHANDVGTRDRANGWLRGCWRHDWPPCALQSARGDYTAAAWPTNGNASVWCYLEARYSEEPQVPGAVRLAHEGQSQIVRWLARWWTRP